MSQHAVKLDFLRRVHRRSAPNRRSAHQHAKKTLKVSWSLPARLQPQVPHVASLGPGSRRHQESVPEPSPHAASCGSAAAGAGLQRRSRLAGVRAPPDGGRARGGNDSKLQMLLTFDPFADCVSFVVFASGSRT